MTTYNLETLEGQLTCVLQKGCKSININNYLGAQQNFSCERLRCYRKNKCMLMGGILPRKDHDEGFLANILKKLCILVAKNATQKIIYNTYEQVY